MQRMATFAAVVEAGTFSAAAGSLGITKAAVSKQIARLEDELGARLLNRTTRRLSLTAAGSAILPHCEQLVAQAAAAVAAAHELDDVDSLSGELVVTAPTGLGQVRVAPLVSSFARAHPRLRVRLALADRVIDLVGEGVDVAIRAGRLPDSSLKSTRLGPLQLVVAAAPDYLRVRGEPRSVDDLKRHDWVSFGTSWSATVTLGSGASRVRLKIAPRFVSDDGAAVRQAARDGLGLTLLPYFWLRDDLESGMLVEVLPRRRPPAGRIHALHPYGNRPPPRVKAFVAHARQAFR